MIAFTALLALAASCSAGSLDHLVRSSPERNYLPPSPTPNNQYLPPSPTPNNQYLPPAPTPNRVYTPAPTQPPSRVYIPPQPTPTPNRYVPPPQPNNVYLPPSKPNNVYLPPSKPNNVYLAPSQPATPSPVYLPASVTPTPINVYHPPPASPNNVHLPPSKPDNVYLPPSSSGSSFGSSSGSFGSSGSSFASSAITGAVFRQQQQLSSSRPVAILKQTNENSGDGVYTFSYETEDGTAAEERGQLRNDGAEGSLAAQGSFAFTAPDNVRYTVTYTADENGFQPQGAHLPVPPPIPEAILKSLADNAADEARGIMDDGSYKDDAQGYPRGSAGSPQFHTGYQYQPSTAGQGYPRERPGQSGYQRDMPSRPFNF